jgi:transcription antitermination protein NusB
MARRSRAREVALQLLFEYDHNPRSDRQAQEGFAHDRLRSVALERFCWELVDGVVAHRSEIDPRLQATADNWRLERMTAVDRNTLRMGAYELLFAAEKAPPAVVVNEAIELARRYGTADSPAFVNGILDRLAHEQPPPSEVTDGLPRPV